MKKIIDGYMYDTNKAEELFQIRRNSGLYVDHLFGKPDYFTNLLTYYKTKNGRYFMTCYDESPYHCMDGLFSMTEERVKRELEDYDEELYIKLFGIKEA